MKFTAKPQFAKIDFATIRETSRVNSLAICSRFLDGYARNGEYYAKNPNRNDKRAGSLKVNLSTGVWCEFTTGESGSDLISLLAWIFGIKQVDAAKRLAELLILNTKG